MCQEMRQMHLVTVIVCFQPVGCDLQLNSDLKIDECGVCGGDGSTCRNEDSQSGESTNTFRWEFGHQLSPCSASCDGGIPDFATFHWAVQKLFYQADEQPQRAFHSWKSYKA